jgi:hypothetical protein
VSCVRRTGPRRNASSRPDECVTPGVPALQALAPGSCARTVTGTRHSETYLSVSRPAYAGISMIHPEPTPSEGLPVSPPRHALAGACRHDGEAQWCGYRGPTWVLTGGYAMCGNCVHGVSGAHIYPLDHSGHGVNSGQGSAREPTPVTLVVYCHALGRWSFSSGGTSRGRAAPARSAAGG